MKIFGTSDLHLDINPLKIGGVKPIFSKDILLIAGDTCETRKVALSNVRCEVEVLADLKTICYHFKQVVLIFGNHEYYGNSIRGSREEFTAKRLEIPNLTILHDASTIVGKGSRRIRIIGSELWTDINRGDPIGALAVGRGMNDYRVIGYDLKRRLRTTDTIQFHKTAKAYLEKELVKPCKIPTIVMVHHAPILSHANSPDGSFNHLNYGFACTDMEDLIFTHEDKVKLWFHGHTHDHKTTAIGNTKVVTHARGYEDRAFDPLLLMEI